MTPRQQFSPGHHAVVPLWRDVRVLRWLFQLAALAIVIAIIVVLGTNLRENLNKVGLSFTFDFLTRPANFDISEGPKVARADPVWKVYLAGVSNTFRVAALGIILATVLGTIVGIARLSKNWLARTIALVFVEIMQNTPLLVQLFFWLVLILGLPRLRREEIASIPPVPINVGQFTIPQLAYFSQRGAALPGIERLESFGAWLPYLFVGLVIAVGVWIVRVRLADRAGRPATGQFWLALLALISVLIVGWIIVPGSPIRMIIPELVGEGLIVNFSGGWLLTNNFQALLVGLTLYTAAFIAEAVRSGIQAVPHGQIEAATSQGFTRSQQLRLIILPQALRVTIPPLINQYLNLTKNSSLAIAVAYPDLFNVSQTIGNQTGQSIQILVMVMLTYLIMSLTISLIMNVINQKMQIKER